MKIWNDKKYSKINIQNKPPKYFQTYLFLGIATIILAIAQIAMIFVDPYISQIVGFVKTLTLIGVVITLYYFGFGLINQHQDEIAQLARFLILTDRSINGGIGFALITVGNWNFFGKKLLFIFDWINFSIKS